MAKIVVVYHSGFGHTKALAESVLAGAIAVAGVEAALISVAELPGPNPDRSLGGRWPELHTADAMIFGCPTYMGSVSAEFKRFMEHTGGLWYQQAWKDKLAAGFTNSGSLSGDKLQTLQDLAIFAAQHSMLWVGTGVTSKGRTDADINRISSYLGVMAQSEQAPAGPTNPAPGDHATAKLLGERVAKAALRWTGQRS